MRNYLKLMIVAAVLAVFSGMPNAALVQAEDAPTLCAAVLPCDGDGNVLPAFSQGPCAEVYSVQCANQATQALGQQLAACEDKSSNLAEELKRAKKQLRSAKRSRR